MTHLAGHVTAGEFARRTGISRRTVVTMLKRGDLPKAILVLGSIWQIPVAYIEKFKSPQHKPKRGRPRKRKGTDENKK